MSMLQGRCLPIIFLPEGISVRKRVITEFSDFEMDGMRFDIKGNLYIARYGKGTVVKISPEGKIIQEIILVGKKPTNIAFGGERRMHCICNTAGSGATLKASE